MSEQVEKKEKKAITLEYLLQKMNAFEQKLDAVLPGPAPMYNLVLINSANKQDEVQIKSNVIPPVNTFIFIDQNTIYHVLGQSIAAEEIENQLTITNEVRLTVRNIASKIITN